MGEHSPFRLEKLCRYVARPPLVTDRLSRTEDGRIVYRLKNRWRNGSTHVVFDPLTFLARLAATDAAVRDALERAQENLARVEPALAPTYRRIARRLEVCLGLLIGELPLDGVEAGSEKAEGARRMTALLPLFPEIQTDFRELRHRLPRLHQLVMSLAKDVENRALGSVVLSRAGTVRSLVLGLREKLGEHRFPFAHGKENATIADVAGTERIPTGNPVAALEAGGQLVEQLDALFFRILGRLATLAEEVETALGLPPLPAPLDDEE